MLWSFVSTLARILVEPIPVARTMLEAILNAKEKEDLRGEMRKEIAQLREIIQGKSPKAEREENATAILDGAIEEQDMRLPLGRTYRECGKGWSVADKPTQGWVSTTIPIPSRETVRQRLSDCANRGIAWFPVAELPHP